MRVRRESEEEGMKNRGNERMEGRVPKCKIETGEEREYDQEKD